MSMVKIKIDIQYIIGCGVFDDIGKADIYYFYPDGIWDDDKLIYKEAIKKYPTDKYNWVLIEDEY